MAKPRGKVKVEFTGRELAIVLNALRGLETYLMDKADGVKVTELDKDRAAEVGLLIDKLVEGLARTR